ncbi:TetR/AcrR family transcriptional regulator [Cupriavidus consociatus]|uniref:TetR/AcrR family transcriptional regulator n=1 Tax=Cupriavidus consociatus TaxID=2821357 RepID=UPI001AE9EAD4|nr:MULTISPECIES: TetR/AcrR family transcriptional regulator [unclassified Cupriavidus]MBP0618780.1 TetR/AcrR family transcriptional regulator [Cupriavidus sp. LEh25]MDK2655421.1 TetR/AcrR family transcriptional regulator [Cupriavidus sp. LEh21]
MTTSTKRPARQSYHHGNLREEMIRCGREILASQGVHGLTLRSAAKLAGVSHGAPRNQFSDKEGLLAAIAAEGFRELVAVRRARLSPDMSAEARLLTVMDGYIEFAVKHPALFYLMFGPQIEDKERYPELLEAGSASYQLLSGAVQDYFGENGLAGQFDDMMVRCAWSAMHGVSMFFSARPTGPSPRPRVALAQWRQSVQQFVLTGLLAAGQKKKAAAADEAAAGKPKARSRSAAQA